MTKGRRCECSSNGEAEPQHITWLTTASFTSGPAGSTGLFYIDGAYIYRSPVPDHDPKPEFYIAG